MLKLLDPLLCPDLLHALASMGHSDEIAVVDANFPGAACAQRLLRLEGAGAAQAVRAILSVMPLDGFGGPPIATMAVEGQPGAVPDAVRDILAEARESEGRAVPSEELDRMAFYARARGAFAVVQTGERRLYGNVLLRKGVVGQQ
ncbi:RbsD/FucU domain-containing protein [Polaromonas sp.]|uniref:RbsD/FucU family protein n=1 Tax=Polaromonas sp. TaxID=1869339 RepID=UPI003264D345